MRTAAAFRRRAAVPCTLLVGALLTIGCDSPVTSEAGEADGLTSFHTAGSATIANHFDAEVPNAWFRLAYRLTQAERLSPPVASRAFGYDGVALYEAVVPGMPGYRSLAGQLNGLDELPKPRGAGLHWPTAANAALATVMQEMYRAEASRHAILALEREIGDRFRAELPPQKYDRSVEWGRDIGTAVVEWSSHDGFDVHNNCAFTPPVGPALWVPTPPGFQANPLQPCWGRVRPFALTDGSACNAAPHPAYSEDPSSPFYAEAVEVAETVNTLTDEQLTIALYWADDPGTTGTPPGHSVAIARQVLEVEEASLAGAAETYAKVGMAVADAFISCWFTKYHYNLLRPITYVHRVIDADWAIPLNTPPFPEYTSGHSVQSGASAQVLTDLFGDLAFTDHTHDELGFAPRSFDSFHDAADEAAISRLYGGIHFRSGIVVGVEQGRCVGRAVSALKFKKSASGAPF